jgi:cell division transport system ATP-binding protein
MDLLDQINMRGTTVLMVTHAKEIVNRMDKRIIAIDKGRVIHDSKQFYEGPMGGDEE